MKKRRSHKKKHASRRSHVMPAASISDHERSVREGISEPKDLPAPPLKRDVTKKADNGGFALKRYAMGIRQFLADAKVELKKVTWPTRKELLSTTAIVIVLVLLVALFLGIVDLGLLKIIKNVIG
jgi:preprotein translocase subunit SecE